MEKLELKHLAPYLPYGLKLERISFKNERFKTLSCYDFLDDNELNNCKPILRPLSDLDKFRKEILKLQEINNDVALLFLNGFCYKELSVWEYEFLLENHFDIYGLIKKGLAVDINTI